MKLVLEFTFEKLEKLSFQKIIPDFFDGTWMKLSEFFFRKLSKNDDRNRAKYTTKLKL